MKKTIAVIAFLTVPALASAQAGLSRVSFLALQQELRDQGCGVTNVDGNYGPQTRRAIAACAKKFGTPNSAAALLATMNIGFGPNDNPPVGRDPFLSMLQTDPSRHFGDREDAYIVPVFYGTDRMRTRLGNTRLGYGTVAGEMELGVAYVGIPVTEHTTGVIESPRTLLGYRIEKLNPAKHFTIVRLHAEDQQSWLREVRWTLAAPGGGDALVYIHGFNNTFDDAVLRAAQLGYDLHMDREGVFMFSWPSEGNPSPIGYTSDEESLTLSRDDLKQFLLMVLDSTGARAVNIVAHSMGSRLLVSVLEDFKEHPPRNKLAEIVLAAPDINAEVFKRVIAPHILGSAARTSIYTSNRDRALLISMEAHAYERLGNGGSAVFGLDQFDKIDASRVDLDLLGHGYFAETLAVIDDLAALLRRHENADERAHLQPIRAYPRTWELH